MKTEEQIRREMEVVREAAYTRYQERNFGAAENLISFIAALEWVLEE